MPEKEPQGDGPQAAQEPLPADEPNTNVKPPRPIWISKSYNPGKKERDGQEDHNKREG